MTNQALNLRGLLSSIPATSPQVPATFNNLAVLYVSTDLQFWPTSKPEFLARDVQIDDTCYRRLDAAYFAWLRNRMFALKQAVADGRVPEDAVKQTYKRFNALQEWAVSQFGEDALRKAMRHLDLGNYRPPRPLESPERISERAVVRTAENARLLREIGLVDMIRDAALAIGWKMERLYESEGFERRPFRREYGLVCYIGEQDKLGAVTRQSIEIIGPPPTHVVRRFYNPDVEQPWVKYIERGK